MTLESLFDAIRVTGSFILIFAVVPFRLMRAERSLLGCGMTIVRTALFMEVAALILGAVHLCLPGAIAGAYLFYCLVCRWKSDRAIEFPQARLWNAHLE